MKHFEYEISGIDGSAAKFVGYCLDNSEEVVPDRVRPSVLVIPGGGYEMTSDREAEPIAMQFLAAGFNAFVLRYSVKPSVFPVALLEAADAMTMIHEHAAEWHVDPDAIAVIGFPQVVILLRISPPPPATMFLSLMVTIRMRCVRMV